MSLIEKYGYCIVPKGTILLRSGESEKFIDCMFFGLDDLVGGNSRRGETQVWKVLYDLTLLFMVSHVTRQAWVISSIVEIYQSEYPEEVNIDDLDIKQRDFAKRRKLINLLKKEGIIGWLSSFEDKLNLEICLFPDKSNFSGSIHPLKSVAISEYEFYNALNDMQIHPSKQFYERSALHVNDFNDYHSSFELKWADQDSKQRDFWKSCNLRIKLRV